MKQNRANYIYQFQGQITHKRLALSPPQSKYAGQFYYVLTIKQPDHSKRSLQVFRSKLAHDSIWTTIEKGECFSTQHTFYCKNQKGYYYLVDWEKTESFNQKIKSTPPKDHDLN